MKEIKMILDMYVNLVKSERELLMATLYQLQEMVNALIESDSTKGDLDAIKKGCYTRN